MDIIELEDFINLYSETNKKQLVTIFKNIIGFADVSWKLSYLKNRILDDLENTSTLQDIITKKITRYEDYDNFEIDFFRYIIGIPVVNLSKLNRILEDWGLKNGDKIPSNIYHYILEINRNQLRVDINDYICQPNEYSYILKFFYIISLIDSKIVKNIDDIEKIFKKINISIDGIEESLYLLVRKYKLLSIKIFEFILPASILDWMQVYGIIDIIIDLYGHVLSKNKQEYIDILQFINSFQDGDSTWIRGDYIKEKFNKNMVEKLSYLQIIDKTIYDNIEVYRISNIGHILLYNRFSNDWQFGINVIIDNKFLYVPHNDNPFFILEYLMKYKLTNPGDYLMIFAIKE